MLERLRLYAFLLGCALLFWQHDASAADWAFAAGIVATMALWERGAPRFDLSWPQPLLIAFLTVAVATSALGGSSRALIGLVFVTLLALALSSALRRFPEHRTSVLAAFTVASGLTALMVTLGALADELGIPALGSLALDSVRGQGLFPDPNVAGAFLACAYPLVAAFCIGLARWRLTLLGGLTLLIAAGVVFSFSRLALGLLLLALVAVLVALAIRRERRMLAGLAALSSSAALAGLLVLDLPTDRYQLIQAYDEVERFGAWGLALDLAREAPLGTGAGSFDVRARTRAGATGDAGARGEQGVPEVNLIRNGGFAGSEGWTMHPTSRVADDPTSVAGRALVKTTTSRYQDPRQRVVVIPGQMYSFGAHIRTDGTSALLIVHWHDSAGRILDQASSAPVTSAGWTEVHLAGLVAPPQATHAQLLLSNLEPGTQHFTAARAVRGARVPEWTPSLQGGGAGAGADLGPSLSTHNTYLRIAVEEGILGLVLIAAYWGALLVRAWRAWRHAWEWPVAFTLLLLAGLVIDSLHWRQLWVYAAVIAGSLASAAIATTTDPSRQPAVRLWGRAGGGPLWPRTP